MDIPEYKKMHGEPKTLEDILNYCAFILGQGGLEHRTLHYFNYFVASVVFGKSEYEVTMKRIANEDPESLAYKIAKGSADDTLQIYEKYRNVYNPGGDHALLEYARAFMDYCEREYLDEEAVGA